MMSYLIIFVCIYIYYVWWHVHVYVRNRKKRKKGNHHILSIHSWTRSSPFFISFKKHIFRLSYHNNAYKYICMCMLREKNKIKMNKFYATFLKSGTLLSIQPYIAVLPKMEIENEFFFVLEWCVSFLVIFFFFLCVNYSRYMKDV